MNKVTVKSNKGGIVEDIRELELPDLEYHLQCVLTDQVSIEAQIEAAAMQEDADTEWLHKAMLALKHKKSEAELLRQVMSRKRKEINHQRNAAFGSVFMTCAKKVLGVREYQDLVNMTRAEMAGS